MKTRKIVKRVSFPKGSKPYMLRVSPDGKQLWVLSVGANTDSLLDPGTLAIEETLPQGKAPVTCAWSPDRRYCLISHDGDPFVMVRDGQTAREIKRIEVGPSSANIGFTPDGKTAYVAVTGNNSVAVIDLASLAVSAHVPTGQQPTGLIVLAPPG